MAVDGDWNLVLETPIGPQEAVLKVKARSDAAFDGALIHQASEQTFEGSIEGDTLIWRTDITSPVPLTLEFAVTVDGGTMSGTVRLGMFGEAPVIGTRV
jgi:hypothetical protein